jgi:hypothetical protein
VSPSVTNCEPIAPTLLSTIGLPRIFAADAATLRAAGSESPPALKGATRVTVLEDCACAPATPKTRENASRNAGTAFHDQVHLILLLCRRLIISADRP